MPATAASPQTRPRSGHSGSFAPWPRVVGCAGGIAALMLAACAHNPQVVVSNAGPTGSGSPVVAINTAQDRALCRDEPATRTGDDDYLACQPTHRPYSLEYAPVSARKRT